VLHEVRIVSVYREPLTTPVPVCICQHLNRVLSVLVRLIGHIMRVARPSDSVCLSLSVLLPRTASGAESKSTEKPK